jgi:chemotaxis protein MotB
MRKKAPEKDNSERYLLTYADLMNLLLILFIILYSMSKVDVQKAAAVAASIRKGFNASVTASQTAQSPDSANTSSTAVAGAGDYSGFYDQLVALIKQAGMQDKVEVVADSTDVVITLKDTALYESGSATMDAQAQSLMSSIGYLLTQVEYKLVMVEGYTDTDPINTPEIPDNRELSTKRANGVCRVLEAAGVPSGKIESSGHGENDPVANNDTSSNKALNRRVVLTIFKSTNGLTATEIITAQEILGLNSKSTSISSSSLSSGTSSSKTSSSKASSSKASSSKTTSSKASSSKTSSK